MANEDILQVNPLSPDAEAFIPAVAASLGDGSFIRLTLGCWRGAVPDLQKASARVVEVKGVRLLSVTSHHKTRDLTTNITIEEAPGTVRNFLLQGFRAARLFTTAGDIQIDWNKDTGFRLSRSSPTGKTADQAGHDRVKVRPVPMSSRFLVEVGVTDKNGHVFPSMSHKWKQINKFVEIVDHAIADSPLATQSSISVADFGSGKGYLTFAVHQHLQTAMQKQVTVTGIDRRADMVDFCNSTVSKLAITGLDFRKGDLQSHDIKALDMLIALHACDTATDEAIALGIRSGATIILCAPCCHKELRPQLAPPAILRPLLRFGVHAAQEAEMLTDGLRALLMESCGYRTQVFEFVSTEHTDKNKMILGVRAPGRQNAGEVAAQIASIKEFYGIREQRLETLLRKCSTGTCAPA